MKKVLFTLATLLAFGATASAYTIGLTLPEEIQMGATTDNSIDVNMMLTELDGICAGAQLEMVFEDPEGNVIPTGAAGTIYLNGSSWATMGEACFPGTSFTASKPNNHYRLMAINTAHNMLFNLDSYIYQDPEDPDADPEEIWSGMTLPARFLSFKVRTRASWAEMEYATLRIIKESSPISWYDNTKNYPLEGVSMKVVNKDYVSTKTIAGEVILGDLDGNFDAPVTINMTDPTSGYVTAVTVNGAEAAIENGVVVLPNEVGEYIVKVVITAEGYEGEVSDTRTYTIEQAAQPQVTVDETATYVTITAKPATSLVVEGYDTMTDEDGSLYVVIPKQEVAEAQTYAYTATNTEAGKLPNTVTGTATVNPLAKAPSNAPEFSITGMDDDYVYITATGTGTVTMLDGHEGNAIDNPVKVARPAYGEPNGSYTAYATNLDEGWYVPTEGNRTFEIPAKDAKVYTTKTPVVTPVVTDDAVTLTATCEDEGTVELHVTYINEDGTTTTEVYTNPASVTINRTDEAQYVTYWATAVANTPAGYDEVEGASSEVVYQYEIPAKPVVTPNQFAGTAGATVAEDGTVTPYYTPADGEELPEDLNVTVNPAQLTEYGEQTVIVTVTGTGFEPKDFPVVVNYEQPQQQEVTVAPSDAKENVVVHENGVYYNAYTVSYTTVAPDTDADVYYRIGVWNEETETYDYPENYTLYTGPFTVDDEGKYMVEAYAIAPNKEKSTFVYTGFEVTVIQDITALNELLGGKEVANVRYFNLAGQEMQEANGMTIVVTTYTDGTTSAVKVMK